MSDLTKAANEEVSLSPYRVTVLYGDHGKRKTTTACSMVNEKGLLLNSDDSWKTLLKSRHKDIFDKLKIISYHGLSQLEHIDFNDYDTVIWDTFSASVDMYIDLLYDTAKWKDGKYREKIITDNKDLKGLEILAPMDYRVTRDIFRPALDKLLKLPVHWVFTSQVNEPIKGLSPDMTKKPAIPNSTFKILARKADIIGQILPVNKKFMIHMEEDSISYLGKSRIEGIEGKMNVEDFVVKYKEIAF
jgi:hypothetical protein